MSNLEQFSKIVGYKNSIIPGSSVPSADGKAYRSTTHYLTGALNALQTGQLIEPRMEKEVGVRSINNAKLGEGIEFLVFKARVLCDTTSGVQAAGAKTAAWKSEAPPALKNGELIIKQGTVLLQEPITRLTNFKGVSTGNEDDFASVVPFALRGNARIDVTIELAGAAAVDQLVRLELQGIEIVDFAQA